MTKLNKYSSNIINSYEFLFILFILCYLIFYIFGNIYLLYASVVTGLYTTFVNSPKFVLTRRNILFLGSLVLLMILNMIYYFNFYFSIFYLIISFTWGYLFFHKLIKEKIVLLFLIMFFLYFLFMVFKNIDPMFMLKDRSRNHISVIVIGITSIYYLIINKRDNIFLWPALITFFVCLLSYGRSGIINATFLLVSAFLFKIISSKSSFKKLFYLLVLLSVVFVLLRFNIYSNVEFLYKFQNQGIESEGRVYIIETYNKNLSTESILFGLPNNAIVNTTGLSLHNSFLSWHSVLGIGSIILFLTTIIIFVKLLIKREYFSLLIFAVILTRSFTDNILITEGFFMGINYFIIFNIAFHDKKKN